MRRADRRSELLRGLGARISEVRRERGLTQEALAEAAGVDPQTVQRAETGRVSLSVPRLQVLADALGIKMADLFLDVGGPVPEVPWTTDEAAVVAAWRRVPEERQGLALRLLQEFGKDK